MRNSAMEKSSRLLSFKEKKAKEWESGCNKTEMEKRRKDL